MHDWDSFLGLGKGKPTEPVPPKPDDPATIMYTSGTTGMSPAPIHLCASCVDLLDPQFRPSSAGLWRAYKPLPQLVQLGAYPGSLSWVLGGTSCNVTEQLRLLDVLGLSVLCPGPCQGCRTGWHFSPCGGSLGAIRLRLAHAF